MEFQQGCHSTPTKDQQAKFYKKKKKKMQPKVKNPVKTRTYLTSLKLAKIKTYVGKTSDRKKSTK